MRMIDADALKRTMLNTPVKAVEGVDFNAEWFTRIADTAMQFTDMVEDAPTVDAVPVPDGGIGELSDGYHTFNGLYYQRMMLFAALVKTYKDRAWKSRRHSDGEPCFGGGWFIVGIDTPQGGFTYHYEDKYFDLFDCDELPNGKEWDGHTEDDVTRLLTLDAVPVVRCGECKYDGRCMFQSFVIDNSRDEVPYDKNTFYCADGERKDGAEKYKAVEDECRRIIGHGKPSVNPMDKLIDALRNCACADGNGSCAKCAYKFAEYSCKWKMMRDAAAALEADEKRIADLESNNPIVESVLVDKLNQRIEELEEDIIYWQTYAAENER